MKYLIVGQNGHGEPIYRAVRRPGGWDWTYYRPHAKRYGSREQAARSLGRYGKRHSFGLRFVVPVTIDVVFRHEFGRIVFRSRSKGKEALRGKSAF